MERLERLAARDATSVGAVAVRELAEVSRRADNPALLGACLTSLSTPQQRPPAWRPTEPADDRGRRLGDVVGAAERRPARQALSGEQLHAPHLVDSEVASGLRRQVNAARLDASTGWTALAIWRRLGLTRYPVFALLDRMWALRDHLSAYDPGYVALADALIFLVLPLAALALWPPVLNAGLDRALALLRRPPLATRLTGRAVTKVALLSGLANVLLGVQAGLFALDLGAQGARVLPVAIGAFTLANVAGLLALPLPAGAGVREVVLVAALSPVLPLATAVVLAVASRVVLTVADLTVAGAAAAGCRRSTRARERGAQGDDRDAEPAS